MKHAKRAREYETRWTVRAADKGATILIAVGGIGTIIAVSAVFVFLVSVVAPLFTGGSAKMASTIPAKSTSTQVVHVGVDEYRLLAWTFSRDGLVRVFRLDSGELLHTIEVPQRDDLTAWSFPLRGENVAFGYRNGTIRLGTMGFTTDFPDPRALADTVSAIGSDEVVTLDGAVVQRTPAGQLRRQRLEMTIGDPVALEDDSPVIQIDFLPRDSGSVVVTVSADGRVRLAVVTQYENLLTGEVVSEVSTAELPSAFHEDGNLPDRVVISGTGTSVYLVWFTGRVVRYDTRSLDEAVVAERTTLTTKNNTLLTSLGMLIGRDTIVIGDPQGRLSAFFLTRSDRAVTPDGTTLTAAHDYPRGPASVTALASSPRNRVIAAGFGDGSVRLYQATNEKTLVETATGDGEAITALAVAPKDDGLVALTNTGIWHFDIDLKYPEATLKSLFRPIWYEGYEAPAHVWQSSSGTDDFEPKLGLWPLIFGTLKATLYSMVFGGPLALLAALFSSEFLAPALRNRIKTLIEFMASLPSVVLGFLAALVFAPFVQKVVPAALVGFLTVPGTVLVGAYLWQMVPRPITLRLDRYRIALLVGLLPLGVLLAVWLGPVVERALFLGDIKVWLHGNEGTGTAGWMILLLPVCGFLVAMSMGRWLTPWFKRVTVGWAPGRVAVLDLARFFAGVAATLGLTVGASWLLGEVGLDPRGPGAFFHTYVQRNALVVGFVMGFAIIPIIYTIAEDALTAVPDHLRAASLGAGATQWQTALRIVIPTAMSGLFSALMIGLGRAVGETMIVLMAAGNTPVLELNIFNGFRTLSANIAVELPEAVRNSTHYRTLFLAALILFVMTFVINTLAELVRLRFRKRASQL